jgi:hypothetical protein
LQHKIFSMKYDRTAAYLHAALTIVAPGASGNAQTTLQTMERILTVMFVHEMHVGTNYIASKRLDPIVTGLCACIGFVSWAAPPPVADAIVFAHATATTAAAGLGAAAWMFVTAHAIGASGIAHAVLAN